MSRALGKDVFKKIEVVGTSTDSVSDAIQNAVRKADESLDNLEWFVVDEIRGYIDDSDRLEYQVTLEIGFQLE